MAANQGLSDMRTFQVLNRMTIDDAASITYLSVEDEDHTRPLVSLRREGSHIAISASYGPLEVALRPRFDEFAQILAGLRPVEGLQTTRQVGSGQSYLAMGLQTNNDLVLRPTLVADATGHLSFNLVLTSDVRQALFDWLDIKAEEA
jgi:hypothetical protein